jgi:threonine/homoserine/homoserine lactone efflux protein
LSPPHDVRRFIVPAFRHGRARRNSQLERRIGVVRSATLGVRNGIAAAFGIVAGDLIFVALAIAGLAAVAELLGTLFAMLRYLAAAYLIWFGFSLIRSGAKADEPENMCQAGGMGVSFAAGVALTLGDVKAILFYAALFPVFVDVTVLSTFDIGVIGAITLIGVGGVKLAYAVAARAIANASQGFPFRRPMRMAAGTLMIGTGGYLIAKG